MATVSWEAGKRALTAVAAAEAGSTTPGGKSRCGLTKARRYMLRKALSVPPPPAPVVLARTLSTITLLVHGYVRLNGPAVAPPTSHVVTVVFVTM